MTFTGADIIAKALYRRGVRHAFGIPGGEVLGLVDALQRAGIEFVIARHENAAGFMAEGSYRATGAPGVLVETVGPGVANGLNSVANADQERVPLIVLTGKVAEEETLQYTHQIFDHQAALRPFVKASFEARIGACDVLIDKAINLALANRPGPVHIDLPIPVANTEHPPHRGSAPALSAANRPAHGEAVERAKSLFENANKPLILAGQDVLYEPGGPEAITRFSRKHRIPVVTSYKAKGVIPETDPLCLGGHGLSPKSDAVILELIGNSDCVICAGYDPIEMRSGWRDPWDPEHAISFTPAENDHFVHREANLFTVPTAEGLSIFDGLAPLSVWQDGEPGAARQDLADVFEGEAGWGVSAAFHRMNDLIPGDAVVTVDSGAHRILYSQIMQCAVPGQLLQSTGLCTMGCGLPLATGYALASEGTSVVALTGDGCLDMVLGELATLRDLQAAVTVVVMVDGSYSLIAQKQSSEGLQPGGVDFGTTNYERLADAMGIKAWHASDEDSFTSALTESLASGQPGLIAVPIPRLAYQGLI